MNPARKYDIIHIVHSEGVTIITALILASGMGTRMGALTADKPKCMAPLTGGETIISRQIRQLCAAGITRIVITTGAFADILRGYVNSLGAPAEIIFVHNPLFADTNYIYSMHLAAEEVRGDMLLIHGDLVFEDRVLALVMSGGSSMAVSSTAPLPEKDFKAEIHDGHISAVGVDRFSSAYAAQPLYKLCDSERRMWFSQIARFCSDGDPQKRKCYAENALNEITDKCIIRPADFGSILCAEADTPDDLHAICESLRKEGVNE